MTRWAMVADLRRCVGCQTCTASCRHRREQRAGPGLGGAQTAAPLPSQCQQRGNSVKATGSEQTAAASC